MTIVFFLNFLKQRIGTLNPKPYTLNPKLTFEGLGGACRISGLGFWRHSEGQATAKNRPCTHFKASTSAPKKPQGLGLGGLGSRVGGFRGLGF